MVMNMENMVKGVCVDYTYDGLGIIKIEGEVLFAKNLIIGEEAKVRIVDNGVYRIIADYKS